MAIDSDGDYYEAGYTAVCEVCENTWYVTAAEADREADWPERYRQSCPKCGSDRVYAYTE